MKPRLSVTILVAAAAVALIATAGCCRRPPDEVGQAEAALAQAREECAEQYAPEEYQSALEAYNAAERYWAEDRHCRNARAAALEAIELAANAEARANERMAELEAEAARLIAGIESAIQDAEAAWAELERLETEVEANRDRASEAQAGRLEEYEDCEIATDWPEVTVDSTPPDRIAEARAQLNHTRQMMVEGECNLLDVIAELNGIPAIVQQASGTISAEAERLNEINGWIEQTLAERQAELERCILERFPPEYVVQRGDCLWRIAEMEMIYGCPFQWPRIWWANQWTEEAAQTLTREERFNLIRDPDLIFPGQVLTINRLDDPDEMRRAEHYARNRYGTTDWRDIPNFLTDGR